MTRATAFAPATIGNVGPGFDVLGLAVDGIGDRVTVELTHGAAAIASMEGRDADLLPSDPLRNAAVIGAIAWLRAHGDQRNPIVSIEKGLPLSGGLGGSAASSVGGAYAAARAAGVRPRSEEIVAAALEGEVAVAGRHLDNIAPCVLGGLALARAVHPIDVIALPVKADWWIAVVTPNIRIETRQAREILPKASERATWIQQMANTAALVHAFGSGDGELLRRALDDRYAEPLRAALIPHFHEAKRAAVLAGAFACSISGSGPTLFAVARDENTAHSAAQAMKEAFREVGSREHCGPIAREGVRDA
jgi:homoserine kinase